MAAPLVLRAPHALILREIATAQGRAAGGYLWAVVEPVAAVALLAAIFALAFDQPPLGRDFAIFYASGYLPYMLYADLAQKLGVALRFSRPLLAYPAVTWWDAIAARFLLNLLVHLMVMTMVLAGLYAVAGGRVVRPDLLRLAPALGLGAALGLGFGTLNAFLFGMVPVWERLWAIANRPLFILSGVVFLPEEVPAPYDGWLWFNPLIHVVGLTREALYPGYRSAMAEPLYVLALALVTLAAALALLGRYASDLLAKS